MRAERERLLPRTPIVDLLDIADPSGISLPPRAGDFGLGTQFKFPFQTIEDVLPIGDDRLLVLNDNNFPFSTGRNAEPPGRQRGDRHRRARPA